LPATRLFNGSIGLLNSGEQFALMLSEPDGLSEGARSNARSKDSPDMPVRLQGYLGYIQIEWAEMAFLQPFGKRQER
jgi:hypothetical protein